MTDATLHRAPLAPLLLVLAAGPLLVLSTRADTIQVADSGELVAAACGVAAQRPAGAPFYLLLGRPLCELPLSTPTGRLGLLSLVASTAALLLLVALVHRITGNRWAGAVAALTLATGESFWRQASQAELFVPQAALSLAALYLALRAWQASSAARQLGWSSLAALASGLALATHQASLLVVPAALLALVLPWRSAGQAALRVILGALALAAGLLPFLLVRASSSGPLRLLREGLLEPRASTAVLAGEPAGIGSLLHFLARLPSNMAWLLWLAALAGLLVLAGRAAGRPFGGGLANRLRRTPALLLLLLALLSAPALLGGSRIAPQGVGAQVLERLHLLPLALLCLCAGIGVAAVEDQVLRGVTSRLRLWRGGLFALLALSAAMAQPHADLRRSSTTEDWARNALSAMEPGAVLAGSDLTPFAIAYAQQVLRLRRDVRPVQLRLLQDQRYLAQRRRERRDFAAPYRGRAIHVEGWLQSELERGVPVYLSGLSADQRAARIFASHRVGPLLRLLLAGRRPPSAGELFELNERLFRGFVDGGGRPRPEQDAWAANLLESYATTWRSIAAGLHAEGERRRALRALARGLDWAPWLPVPDWFGPRQRAR